MKRFIKFLALGVALVAVIVLWNVFQAARTSLDAEWTLHAYYCALELTDHYQKSHQGEWPPDWRALEQIPYARASMWNWPEDAADIQQRITIDFNVSPEDVAAMSVDDFRAIRQREPCFPTSADWRVQALINDNRERLGMPTK